ncbi:hypothetical protein HDV02_001168 [Globomyces sp. JEL0801]|nr:hypothetical protein HDV02_001168 [Globomyces sp. JEL0801]
MWSIERMESKDGVPNSRKAFFTKGKPKTKNSGWWEGNDSISAKSLKNPWKGGQIRNVKVKINDDGFEKLEGAHIGEVKFKRNKENCHCQLHRARPDTTIKLGEWSCTKLYYTKGQPKCS